MTQDTNPYASPTIGEESPRHGRSFWRTVGRVVLLGVVGYLIGGAVGGISGGAGAATLGATYVVASSGQPTDALPGPKNPADFAIGIIGLGAMLGGSYGAMLGSGLGCLLGVVLAIWKCA